MSGKRVNRNTLEPRLATRSAMYLFTPEISEITTMRVETERMMPSSIRKERILCCRNVSSATPTGSRSSTPRFDTPLVMRAHAPCPFYAQAGPIVSRHVVNEKHELNGLRKFPLQKERRQARSAAFCLLLDFLRLGFRTCVKAIGADSLAHRIAVGFGDAHRNLRRFHALQAGLLAGPENPRIGSIIGISFHRLLPRGLEHDVHAAVGVAIESARSRPTIRSSGRRHGGFPVYKHVSMFGADMDGKLTCKRIPLTAR